MKISAVARIMQPGCKVDTVLTLEGGQGKKKSSGIERLFGKAWFTDDLAELRRRVTLQYSSCSDMGGRCVVAN